MKKKSKNSKKPEKILLALLFSLCASPASAASKTQIIPLPGFATFYIREDLDRDSLPDLLYYAGYRWDRLAIFEPSANPKKLGNYQNYFPRAGLGFARTVLPDTKVRLLFDSQYENLMGGAENVPYPKDLYLNSQSVGWVNLLTLGFTMDRRDNPDFPLKGNRVKLDADFGLRPLGNSSDFSLYTVLAQHFLPIDRDSAIAFNTIGRYGLGNIPWSHKFDVGSDNLLRGYDLHRFSGDRSLVGNVEYRRFLFDFDSPWLSVLADKVGVGSNVFLDGGRSWESTRGPKFPDDMRADVGCGMLLFLDKSPFCSISGGLGNEGFHWDAILGYAF